MVNLLLTLEKSNFLKLVTKISKKLCSSVRSSTSQRKSASSTSTIFSSEDLADYFTDIATNSTYDQALINDIITSLSSKIYCSHQTSSHQFVYEYEVYRCLSAVKKTVSGPENTAYWLFKHLAMEFTPVVTHIINLTLTYGRPPSLWKRAIITPAPKIPNPTELSDFEIAITS